MTDLIASFVFSHLVWFCLLVASIIFLLKRVKKLKNYTVILNAIWFSEDGSLPKDAQDNLIKLAKKINFSPYQNAYQLFLWTDKNKLPKKTIQILQKARIVIKDYRNVNPFDEASKKLNNWIHELIELGDQSNKYFYCLASDLLRFYLLFKEFPEHYKNAVTLYIDCNDVDIINIHPPSRFDDLKVAAFHLSCIKFCALKKLIDCELEPQFFWTNDVIAVANKTTKREYLNTLFEAYYNNLVDIDTRTNGMIVNLKATKSSVPKQDKILASSIVFAISHMTTIFRLREHNDKTYVFNYGNDNTITLKAIDWIQDVSAFVNFEPIYEKGFVWGKTAPGASMNESSPHPHRQFWYDLFALRYQLLINTLDDKIAEANVAHILFCQPRSEEVKLYESI